MQKTIQGQRHRSHSLYILLGQNEYSDAEKPLAVCILLLRPMRKVHLVLCRHACVLLKLQWGYKNTKHTTKELVYCVMLLMNIRPANKSRCRYFWDCKTSSITQSQLLLWSNVIVSLYLLTRKSDLANAALRFLRWFVQWQGKTPFILFQCKDVLSWDGKRVLHCR